MLYPCFSRQWDLKHALEYWAAIITFEKWKKYGKTGENDEILQLFHLEIYKFSCRFRKKNKSLLTKKRIGNKIDTR